MIISPDHFLYDADGTYFWTRERQTDAWKQTISRVTELLKLPLYRELVLLVGLPGSGKSTWLSSAREPTALYVDATFCKRQWREPFVELSRAAGKPITAVWLQTPVEVCIARNLLRSEDRAVPEGTMLKMAEDLRLEPPSLEEGFALVSEVVDERR